MASFLGIIFIVLVLMLLGAVMLEQHDEDD
jgi:preprotein translocase subunit SecG